MRKWRIIMLLTLVAAMVLTGCTKKTDDPATTESKTEATTESTTEAKEKKVHVTIDGYSAENPPHLDGSLANEPLLLRLMAELTGTDEEMAETYLSESFVNGGTSTSWDRLLNKEMDLIVSYEAPDEVKEDLGDALKKLEITPLGRDGLVFIVNVDNPVESLTVDQIRDIYTGKITNWKEVGGNDEAIAPFQRNSTSGSQTLLNNLVMNGEKTMEPGKEFLIGTMGELIERVAAFDGKGNAIGFSVYYYADKMKGDPNLKMIKVNDVAPSNESIGDGAYPLVNDFYVAIRGKEKKDSPARTLRDWLLSEEGKALMVEEGYVPVP